MTRPSTSLPHKEDVDARDKRGHDERKFKNKKAPVETGA
jgi:hypothetical protein